MSEITVGVRLKADGSGFVGAVKLSRAEMDKFAKAEGKAAGKAATLNARTKGLAQSFGTLRRLLLAGVVAGVVREFVKLADTSKLLSSRLSIVSKSSAELTKIQTRLFEISQRTRTSLEATSELFARIGLARNEIGRSADELLRFTENIQKLVIISGASADEARGAIIQLSQGLASGTLRGDELRSVMEQLPAIARAIAKSMGVSIGRFRQLALQGKITTQDVIGGVLKQTEQIDKDFAKIKKTIGQASTQAGNSLLRLVGVFDKATGTSRDMAKGITNISSVLDDLSAIIKVNEKGIGDFSRGLERFVSSPAFKFSFFGLSAQIVDGFKSLVDKISRKGAAARKEIALTAEFERRASVRELAFSGPTVKARKTPPPSAAGKISDASKLIAALKLEEAARIRLSFAQAKGARAVAEVTLQNKILAAATRAGIAAGTDQFRTVDRLIRSIEGLKTGEAAAIKTAKRDKAIREEVTGKLREMATGYVAAALAAKTWKIEALDGLDKTKPGFDAFAAKIDEVYNRMLADAYDRALENSRRWEAGVVRGLRNYAREATDGARQAEDALVGSLDAAKRVFVEFAATGKFEFGSLVDFIKRKAAEIVFDQTVGGFLQGLLPQAGSLLKELFGVGGASAGEAALLARARARVGQFHSGGCVGGGGAMRPVHPGVFAQAQRFATGGFPGLAADEVPAILHRNEGVFTPRQMDAAGGIISALAALAARPTDGGGGKVEIIDQRGAGSADLSTSQRPDPTRLGRMITTIVIPELGREISRGALDQPIAARFALRPVPQGG